MQGSRYVAASRFLHWKHPKGQFITFYTLEMHHKGGFYHILYYSVFYCLLVFDFNTFPWPSSDVRGKQSSDIHWPAV